MTRPRFAKRILPVIDIQGGVVVRGVAGQREKYLPVQSVLMPDPSPGSVASAFRRRLGSNDVYVADLDAIAGAEPAWEAYRAIAAAGQRLWVDAGIGNAGRARKLRDRMADLSIYRVIVALESITTPDDFEVVLDIFEPGQTVFSLDMKQGRPFTQTPPWKDSDPLQIAAHVVDLGIHSLIVLDLSRVGVGQGTGTEQLCKRIRQRWPDIELIGGGGVSSTEDIERLCESGLSRVLVASALHDGRIQ